MELGTQGAANVVEMATSTVHLYAKRLNLPPAYRGKDRRFSTGDLVLIEAAKLLHGRGLEVATACEIARDLMPEFTRLIAGEEDGARAWLIVLASGDREIVRDAAIALRLIELPGAWVIDADQIMRDALIGILAKLKEARHAD